MHESLQLTHWVISKISANSQFVVIRCELESFLSFWLIVDGDLRFMYVKSVPITGKGEGNGFNKKHEC